MSATPPPTPPPIAAPRWLGDDDDDDDEGEAEAAETVWITVVVMSSPLAADVTDTTELKLVRLVGDCFAAPPPALLVVDVDVGDFDVEVGVDEVEVEDDDADAEADADAGEDVDVVSLDVVSELPGFPIMAAEATAGPVVLIEATELPSRRGKNSLELVLSQQTLDAFRL